jgi:DNA mismatch repair protein MutS
VAPEALSYIRGGDKQTKFLESAAPFEGWQFSFQSMGKTATSQTPLMKQYTSIKSKYPDALLLFRVGDFYEMFGEDAVRASRILGIVLTKRKNGAAAYVDLAGFPHHSLDTYLPKLVRAGNRVAICDQLEDPKKTKTIVKRGVTELVTPAVSYNDHVLDSQSNNFLAAVCFSGPLAGVAFLDISTGEFLVAEGSLDYVDKLLQGFSPNEVLIERGKSKIFRDAFGTPFYTYELEDWVFTGEFSQELLQKHFSTTSLKGFGIAELPLAIVAAGASLYYLAETKHDDKSHIQKISRIEEDRYMWLDKFTVRNLELIHSPHEQASTLLHVLDKTVSPMGSRLMRRWIVLPLKDIPGIKSRHEIVEALIKNTDASEAVSRHLKQVGDLERIAGKAAFLRINPKEVAQLKRSLQAIAPIREFCNASSCDELKVLGNALTDCPELQKLIGATITDDPPLLVSKGNVIRSGVHDELDELRSIAFSGKDYLLKIQERESAATGIPSLKIAYNNVFGYYLEVRNAHKDKVPVTWIRKQTITQAERYITEELKEYETKILGAEEKIQALESHLYGQLVQKIGQYVGELQRNAHIIAEFDCLLSFAKVAIKNSYVRPSVDDSLVITIKEGRHPVIEQYLPDGEAYVANDVYLDSETQQIMMITGPNMSGKSALLRQTALIVLMAQIGSFVPAKSANIGLVDKIFTRVGASDNISSGESTFMVEMNETASILNNLSSRSLVLLDEIGRGTSTYDGISIAWAITEYIHQNPTAQAKTLFATHYHELNEMTHAFERIKNFNVSVKDLGKKVIFLRKLAQGGSNHSFGIHVAKMAGMPSQVLNRAKEILVQLESSHVGDLSSKAKKVASDSNMQLSFFQLDDPVLEQIKDEIQRTDINTLTPVEALLKLNDIKKMVGGR